MKRNLIFISALVLIILTVCITAITEELIHADKPPKESSEENKITIIAVENTNDRGGLPSEYHVRVRWNIQNRIYSATETDGQFNNDFLNFIFDEESKQYMVNRLELKPDEYDFREKNWLLDVPKVEFEVTNASTPDLLVYVSAQLSGEDKWQPLMFEKSLIKQNHEIGVQEVKPVLRGNMGTGRDSYELGITNGDAHNDYDYAYVLNWDYDALNELALSLYNQNAGLVFLNNTFVVTINPRLKDD